MRHLLLLLVAILAGCSQETVGSEAPERSGPEPRPRSTSPLSFGSIAGAVREPDESAYAFASRVLDEPSGLDVVESEWNGQAVLFASYYADGALALDTIRTAPNGTTLRTEVTRVTPQGGPPFIDAIAFANADEDAQRELVIIQSWPQYHLDVSGTLYSVRFFDDPGLGTDPPTELSDLSRHFDLNNCDCTFGDGRAETYPFKTVEAVRAELARLGFVDRG